MSASPLVLRPSDVRSPLKSLSSAQASASGTPRPAATSTSTPAAVADTFSLPPTLDLAEQMNEEEKRKYVKGEFSLPALRGHSLCQKENID